MDENNNNQASQEEEMSLPPVKNFDPKLFVAVVVIILLLVGFMVTMLDKTNSIEPVSDQIAPAVVDEVITPTNPEKVSAGEALPTGFPKDVLTEPLAKLDQSYTLKYAEGEQATVVFVSNQGIKENYALYLAELRKDAWIIVSAKETEKVSAIYAMKDTQEINITIVLNQEGKAEVSISTFNK